MGFENFANNLDVRQHLQDLGYVREGIVITPEDYATIDSRAHILMREARERGTSMSEEVAVPMAYFDRMMLQGHIGVNEIVDMVEPATFRELLGAYAGHEYTEEETEAFIRYMRGQAERQGSVLTELVQNWITERATATENIPNVAVADGEDLVRGVGDDARDLMRKAQSE